jgi:hypothetical protein
MKYNVTRLYTYNQIKKKSCAGLKQKNKRIDEQIKRIFYIKIAVLIVYLIYVHMTIFVHLIQQNTK